MRKGLVGGWASKQGDQMSFIEKSRPECNPKTFFVKLIT
jgi:hypothetical protein